MSVLEETEDQAVREQFERCLLVRCLFSAEEPRDVDEALASKAWKGAMDVEMQSIIDNKTWELAQLPGGHTVIGLKWVYRVKRDPDGKIIKYKARLVAKGYVQREGVDFEEVFAPVARMETAAASCARRALRLGGAPHGCKILFSQW